MFEGKEYVYEIYKTKSFSKAALNLYISQPSLSATIKKIEQRLGAPIFDRSTSPVHLTDCGQKYIKYIEQIFDLENEFESELHSLAALRTGNLILGGSNLFASYILPPLITSFIKKYPLVNVEIVEANTKSLEKQLFEGTLDLIIDNYSFHNTLYCNQLFRTEHLLLAVPNHYSIPDSLIGKHLTQEDIHDNKHMDTSIPAVSLKHFKGHPFVLLRSGNDTRERSEKLLRSADMAPNISLELDQQVTAYNIACYGMGITFISDTLIKQVPKDSRLRYYKLDSDVVNRNICFYYKKSRYVTRAMSEFLKLSCPPDNI